MELASFLKIRFAFSIKNKLFVNGFGSVEVKNVDEDQNFEQLNFRMSDISNLKINEHANVH